MRRPISSPLAGLWLLVFLAFTFRVKSTSIGNKSDDERRRPTGQRKCFAYAAAFIPFEVFNACAALLISTMGDLNELKAVENRVESSRKALLFIISNLNFIFGARSHRVENGAHVVCAMKDCKTIKARNCE